MSFFVEQNIRWVANECSNGFVEITPYFFRSCSAVAYFVNYTDADLFRRSKNMEDFLRSMEEVLGKGMPTCPEAQLQVWNELRSLVVSCLSSSQGDAPERGAPATSDEGHHLVKSFPRRLSPMGKTSL